MNRLIGSDSRSDGSAFLLPAEFSTILLKIYFDAPRIAEQPHSKRRVWAIRLESIRRLTQIRQRRLLHQDCSWLSHDNVRSRQQRELYAILSRCLFDWEVAVLLVLSSSIVHDTTSRQAFAGYL